MATDTITTTRRTEFWTRTNPKWVGKLLTWVGKTPSHIPEAVAEENSNGHTLSPREPHRVAVVRIHDMTRLERLGRNYYLAVGEKVPQQFLQRWNDETNPHLENAIGELVRSAPFRDDKIMVSTELRMAGEKNGGYVDVQPTIMVTCGSKRCLKRIKNGLNEMSHISAFGQPIFYRRVKHGVDWASFDRNEQGPSGQIGNAPGPEDRPTWRLLSCQMQLPRQGWTLCGSKLKAEVEINAVPMFRYGRMGGLIEIDGIVYGLTTAHTFVANFPHDEASALDEESGSSSAPDSEDEERSSESRQSLRQGPTPSDYGDSFPFDKDGIYAFAGEGGRLSEFEKKRPCRPNSDWAAFKMDSAAAVVNSYWNPQTSSRVVICDSILDEKRLPGDVYIISDQDESDVKAGVLMEPKVSFFTNTATFQVREIRMEGRPATASSGSWVVRGEQLLGYIVAVNGCSSYMMSIDSVFKSIQDFFETQKVQLFSKNQSENEFGSIALSQTSAIDSGTLSGRNPHSKRNRRSASPEAPCEVASEPPNVDLPSVFFRSSAPQIIAPVSTHSPSYQISPIDRNLDYETEREVQFIYEKYNLSLLFDIHLLKRGAELSRNHRNFMLRNDLSPVESRALENDYKGKIWPQSPALKAGLLTCCTAAVVQGWSQASITGANLSWPGEFGLDVNNQAGGHSGDLWVFGMVNLSIYLGAGFM
ncbi:hypothetical protein V8E54_014098 [Elaphomyces granulatus]